MKKPDNNKPFPLRLGDLKPFLQQQAVSENRSLSNLIKSVLLDYKKKKQA